MNITLTVFEVPFEGWSAISEVAQKWALIAQEKAEEARKMGDDRIFGDSEYITRKIHQDIEISLFPGEVVVDTSLFVCSDHTSTVQGIAFFSPGVSDISLLASNPNHLPHPINDEAKRVRGVGTAIILHLAQIAQLQNKPLTLLPLCSARPFYERLGFEESTNCDLILTCDKIQELLAKKRMFFS
jgi:hypothetical protein